MDVLLETKRSLRVDLQVKRQEARQAADQIEALEAKLAGAVARLEERNRLAIEVQNLKAERDKLKEEKQHLEDDLPRRLEEAGDAGFNETSEYCKEQVEGLVKKAFQDGELKGIQDIYAQVGYQDI
ncbi:hypothetical protein RHMOL_Rhmol09G0092300 [Rhododendron molle]|uniref:Uncharacterized protein n=1 Tax=Rhododendron molle TaxID=49168 RepID=A0ACC0MCM3_RHOML|nr:hypothetical protein RHMOL_Rhmol09G0092300 [Rhododendron molle]